MRAALVLGANWFKVMAWISHPGHVFSMTRARQFLFFALAFAFALAAQAQTFEDGLAAYDRGEFARAYEIWKPLAERDDLAAQRNIGHLYRFGRGVQKDLSAAAQWYRRAADRGFDRAQANLAALYLTGEGVEQNYREAAIWFERAARQGHVISQYNLGLLYETGAGVEASLPIAMGWYSMAARAGHPMAQQRLEELTMAMPTLDGRPGTGQPRTTQDLPRLAQTGLDSGPPPAAPTPATPTVAAPTPAAPTPQPPAQTQPPAPPPAAFNPQPPAQTQTAAPAPQAQSPAPTAAPAASAAPAAPPPIPERPGDLQMGDVAARNGDFREAYAQWLPLARKGDSRAQLRLARLYNAGQGVAQNIPRAYMWLSLSAAQGNGEAMTMMAALSRVLSPEDISLAKRQAPGLLTQ